MCVDWIALTCQLLSCLVALNSASLVSASSLVTWKDTFGFPNEDARMVQCFDPN